jgi:transcriptional regulator GlxA family with amidase domain
MEMRDAMYSNKLRMRWVIHELSCSDLRNPALLHRIANRVNLSLSRFRHLFTQFIGVSPSRYLKQMRLARARHLLENSLLTVKEVAAAVGVNDVSHFVRDYKEAYGENPSESRHRALPVILVAGGQHGQQDSPTHGELR